MTDYIYHGPMQGLTLTDASGTVVFDGMLHPGKPCTLPADHPHVESFVAGRLLEPVPAEATADPEKTEAATKRRPLKES